MSASKRLTCLCLVALCFAPLHAAFETGVQADARGIRAVGGEWGGSRKMLAVAGEHGRTLKHPHPCSGDDCNDAPASAPETSPDDGMTKAYSPASTPGSNLEPYPLFGTSPSVDYEMGDGPYADTDPPSTDREKDVKDYPAFGSAPSVGCNYPQHGKEPYPSSADVPSADCNYPQHGKEPYPSRADAPSVDNENDVKDYPRFGSPFAAYPAMDMENYPRFGSPSPADYEAYYL